MTSAIFKSTGAIIIYSIATLGILAIIGYNYWGWFGGSTPKLNIVSADKKSIDFEWAIGNGGAEYSYVAGVSGNPEIYPATNTDWSLSVSDFTKSDNPRYEFKILKGGVQQSDAIVKKV